MEADVVRGVIRIEGLGSTMLCHRLKDNRSGSGEDGWKLLQ